MLEQATHRASASEPRRVAATMMWWWGQGPGWIGMAVGGVLLLGFLAAIVVVGVVVARRAGSAAPHPPAATDPAEATLAQRYAAGEIDDEEFTRRRSVLRARQ
jgi:putative membrane protein